MGLLDRIQQARNPQNAWPVGRAEVSSIESEWGHDDGTYSPAEYGDYLVTSNEVFAAASLRARLMSSLELNLYRGRGPEKAEITAGRPFELLQYVNPFWTPQRLARMDELAMCLWGETYWVIEKNAMGEPTEIWWAKPSKMTPVPDANGYLKGFLYEPSVGEVDKIPFAADEVIWFRYPNPLDEFSALSPLSAARLAADTASSMMKSNRNLFSQGLMGGGVLMPSGGVTYSSEQARELEKDLDRRFKGVEKAHRWGVLRFEAQTQNLSVSPKDAEFINGLHLTIEQIGNAYGIPAPLLNHAENATLANLREYQKSLWEHALVPDSQLKAAEIEEQFLPMFRGLGRAGRADHCAFDYSKVAALQESSTAVWDRERQALEIGAMTINEWRKKHGMPPVEWGDVFWAPVNKAPVTSGEDNPADNPDVPNDPVADAEVENQLAAMQRQVDLLAMREQPAPITVHVDAPEQPRQTKRRVERDEQGRVVAVVDA